MGTIKVKLTTNSLLTGEIYIPTIVFDKIIELLSNTTVDRKWLLFEFPN